MMVCRYGTVQFALALLLAYPLGSEAAPARDRPPRNHPAIDAPAPKAEPADLVADKDTVFNLDGKKCKLVDVPAGAEVTLLEVAADGKTIIRIDFQTPKKEQP